MDTLSLTAAESFNEVMELYMPMVYRIAFSRLADRNDAEDITQDVFLRYYRAGITYISEEHRKAWLIRCTINCAKNVLSSAYKRHKSAGELTENNPPPESEQEYSDCEESFEKNERKSAVLAAVMELSEKYRTVIHLFYFEDMSVTQISEATGRRESTIKSQLCRGRKLLEPVLRKMMNDGEVDFR